MFWMLVLALPTAQQPMSVENFRLTPLATHQVELGKNGVKGAKLEKLAWSPDRTELYLMTYDPNIDATIKQAYHYVIQAATGAVKSVNDAPAWANTYWSWKSDRSAPGDPGFEIALTQDRRRAETGVATPMGGEMARGGTSNSSGISSTGAIDVSRGMQFQNVYTLMLKGETIGEWIDHRIQPGLTFGWGPSKSGVIAFADKDGGKLVVMDRTGKKQKIDGTKGVMLPAWTDDGSRFAYVETRGKNKYAVIIAEIK